MAAATIQKAAYRQSRTPADILPPDQTTGPLGSATTETAAIKTRRTRVRCCPSGPPEARVLATFDISNTRIKAGIFDGPDLRATFSLAADVRRTADEYAVLLDGLLREERIQRRDVHGIAIASVVPPLTGIF